MVQFIIQYSTDPKIGFDTLDYFLSLDNAS